MSEWKKRRTQALKENEGKDKIVHAWFFFKEDSFRCCAKCGIIERSDGKNGPCPGVVKITLRNNEN